MNARSNTRLGLPLERSLNAPLRLPRPPRPRVFSSAAATVEILLIELLVDQIVPGQPVAFSFETHTYLVSPDIGSVSLSLYLVDSNGSFVFGMNSPLWTQALSSTDRISPYPYVSQKFTFVPPAAQQAAVWKIGSGYYLRLIATGNGKAPGPWVSLDAALDVVYETIDQTWWAWTVPQYRQVQWKVDDYPMNGSFYNRSQYSSFTINSAVLVERNITDQLPPDNEYSGDQAGTTVASGGVQTITFSNKHLAKTFDWYIDGIYKIEWENTDKLFIYAIQFDLRDQWANSYPVPTFAPVLVEVVVSDQKQHACIAAFSAFNVWAAESILFVAIAWLGPIAAPVAAIATAAAAALGIAGRIASDPPSPDPEYATPVDISPPATSPSMPPELSRAFEILLRILASVDALSTIEGRIMGAVVAEHRDAELRQRDHYVGVVHDIETDAGRIAAATEKALPALHPELRARREALAGAAESRDAAPREELSPEVKAAISVARFAAPGIVPSNVEESFEHLAAAVRNLALAAVGMSHESKSE